MKEAGADVVVVSPEIANEEGVTLIKKNCDECFLGDALLVIAATDNETINKKGGFGINSLAIIIAYLGESLLLY